MPDYTIREFVSERLEASFPHLFPREESSVFHRYITAHQEILNGYNEKLDEVLVSRSIDDVGGANLDLIASIHGVLAHRRGRSDTAYRSYISSIVQSFSGRGTRDGVLFAISAGTRVDETNVTIVEDVQNLEVSLEITSWESPHSTDVINDMADLALASVVEFVEPIAYVVDGDTVSANSAGVYRGAQDEGLGAGTVGDSQIGSYE